MFTGIIACFPERPLNIVILALQRQLLRDRIPAERLNPFNFLLPTPSHMFYGRKRELNHLLQQEEVSFAVAGPGRIGKTSLLEQYHRELRRRRHPRAERVVKLDLYEWENSSEDELARHIALAIAPSRRSAYIAPSELPQLLRKQRDLQGGPCELLLDEVDGACFDPAFEILADAVKNGLCRVVLCGRGNLLQMMLSNRSQLEGRLELLRPEPLDASDARALLEEPFRDLGFEFENREAVLDQVLDYTGRLPHQLQFYGKKLLEMAQRDGTTAVSLRHTELVRDDLLTFEYFTSPLMELKEDDRKVATAFLKHPVLQRYPVSQASSQRFSVPDVKVMAKEAGVSLDEMGAWKACNELLIQNVLAWDSGAFRVANASLVYYAQRLGVVNGATCTIPTANSKS